LAVALLLASALGLAGVLWEWRRAVHGELALRQRLYVSDMKGVHQAWEEGDLKSARELLLRHIPKSGQTDLRGFEWRYLWRLCRQDDSIFAFTNFADMPGRLAYSPDGKVLAVAAGRSVKLLDIPSRRELGIELKEPDAEDFITHVAWSPVASDVLFTAGSPGVIKQWNLRTKDISVFAHFGSAKQPTPIQSVALSPDGKLLAVALGTEAGQSLRVWNVEPKKEVWFKSPPNPVYATTFTKDGRMVVSDGGKRGSPIMLWDAASGKEILRFPAEHSAMIHSIVFSPDGRTVATEARDNRIILRNFADQQRKQTLSSPLVEVVAFSPDGALVASGGDDGLVRVWEVATGKLVALLRGHTGMVSGLSFTPDGEKLVSGSSDRTVRIWSPKTGQEEDVLLHQNENVSAHCVSFSLDGKRLASASGDRDWVEVWDVSARRCLTNLTGHIHDVWGVSYSPDGKLLASGSSDCTIRLWDPDSHALIGRLTNDLPAGPFAFSPDSRVLAVASFTTSKPDGSRRLTFWDIPSRKRLELLAAAAPDASSVGF
jgi:WD40 repeat protein